MTILCSLKNISLSFGSKIIFKDSSFQINHGEKIGLIGLNGRGKSSLFKLLTEELTPDQSKPKFIFDKASSSHGIDKEYNVFLVDQKFKALDISVEEFFFIYYPEFKDAGGTHLEERYWKKYNAFSSYLKSFGVDEFTPSVLSLSGGEQKKILLSLGLISDSNLILWDEPTNHLDMETIELFEIELSKTTKSFVIISHDRHLLTKVCDKILHINNAKINEFKGNYTQYLEYLNVEEENRLKALQKLQNTLRRETDWMRQGIKARGTRAKSRVDGYMNLKDKIGAVKGEARKVMELSINNITKKTKELITFKDVSFGYDGQDNLFNDLNFKIFKGDKIGILGNNGEGKSTLIHMLARKLTGVGSTKYADDLSIALFEQKREEVFKDSTPRKLLGRGEDYIHFNDGRSIHVTSYFKNFLFDTDELDRPLSSFSGGEINRLQLAINLKNEADLWIFDEPTNDLDIESIEILEQKLAEFKGNVIIISHDRSFLENVTNKIWLLKDTNLEVFSSGYTHVIPYLEACKIEDSYNDSQSFKKNKKNKKISAKTKNKLHEDIIEKEKIENPIKENGMSNNKRLNELPNLIEKIENQIERLDKKLNNFDYSNMDTIIRKDLDDTTSLKELLETKLIDLYEELENLSS